MSNNVLYLTVHSKHTPHRELDNPAESKQKKVQKIKLFFGTFIVKTCVMNEYML